MNRSHQHNILDQYFIVEGDTLSDVAQGLVLVLQHQHVNHPSDLTYHLMLPQETFGSSFTIKPEMQQFQQCFHIPIGPSECKPYLFMWAITLH